MHWDDGKQTMHLQRDTLLLSLAGPQPKTSSSVWMPKFFLAPTENQADRPECPKVKMTHYTDFNNTDQQPGALNRKDKQDFASSR